MLPDFWLVFDHRKAIVKRLRYLARSYFHQDWDIEAPTPVGVVVVFRDQEVPEVVEELRQDLQAVLASHRSEDALAEIWDRCGADWDPQIAQLGSYREWFDAMLKAVS
ncbi:contact-dependent growth inhibition system immunity protein [Luteimicrobium sp. DT211]|uniref:contact-dependent growth inhibition system immunity protein n=1 Tax=Luteimicrobium sp. DT211 TaxID=3393412 RepID=UPI003CE7D34B